MRRRTFLKSAALLPLALAPRARPAEPRARELRADVVVIGGGTGVAGDRVRTVTVRDLRGGRDVVLTAPYFLDATELGDLLPLTKAEYVVGAEAQKDTGEPHATAEARPQNQQAFTCCFAMDYL